MTSRDSLSMLVTLELRERLNELSLASESMVAHQGQKKDTKQDKSVCVTKNKSVCVTKSS